MASNNKLMAATASLAYLQEIYIRHINEILQPLIYEILTKIHSGAISDYNKARGREKKSIIMYFQERLAAYSRSITNKEEEYEDVIKNISPESRELLEKLLFALFEKFIKAHNPKMNKTLVVELIPSRHEVYHTLFIDICREIWSRAYLFDDRNITDTERQRNLNDIRTIIYSKIKEGLQKLMPLKMLIKLTQDEELPEDISEPVSKNQRAKLNKLLQEESEEESGSEDESESGSEEEEESGSEEEEESESGSEEEEESESEEEAEPVKEGGTNPVEVTEVGVDVLLNAPMPTPEQPPMPTPEPTPAPTPEQLTMPPEPIPEPVVPLSEPQEVITTPVMAIEPELPPPVSQDAPKPITQPALVIKRTTANSKKKHIEHSEHGERRKDSEVAKKKLLF